MKGIEFSQGLSYATLMFIHLNEIPETGSSWKLTHKTGELTDILADLIANSPFEAEFSIKPLELPTFEISGSVKTASPEQCSRCGDDFSWEIAEKFRELLIPKLDQPRNSHFAKPNHFSDTAAGEQSTAEYSGQVFNLGEYIHEIVALAIPAIPAPALNAQDKCSICGLAPEACILTYSEEIAPLKANPFSVLGNLKKQ